MWPIFFWCSIVCVLLLAFYKTSQYEKRTKIKKDLKEERSRRLHCYKSLEEVYMPQIKDEVSNWKRLLNKGPLKTEDSTLQKHYILIWEKQLNSIKRNVVQLISQVEIIMEEQCLGDDLDLKNIIELRLELMGWDIHCVPECINLNFIPKEPVWGWVECKELLYENL